MVADVTPAVERALNAAQEHARRRGAAAVQPVHILAGLVEEPEGQAALSRARLGVAIDSLRTALVPPAGVGGAEHAAIPLASTADDAFALAHRRARDEGDGSVSSPQLLWAI